MTTPVPDWDAAYEGGAPAPWDIGRPQPALARLAGSGVLCGRVLDAGCGTGEQALLAAAAARRSRAKAAGTGLPARFEVADALNLAALGTTFDTIIDSGLFHVFDDGAAPVRQQPGVGAAVRRHLLPNVLQRPPAGRLRPPAGPPGPAACPSSLLARWPRRLVSSPWPQADRVASSSWPPTRWRASPSAWSLLGFCSSR